MNLEVKKQDSLHGSPERCLRQLRVYLYSTTNFGRLCLLASQVEAEDS